MSALSQKATCRLVDNPIVSLRAGPIQEFSFQRYERRDMSRFGKATTCRRTPNAEGFLPDLMFVKAGELV
jgi:hypothetical protein